MMQEENDDLKDQAEESTEEEMQALPRPRRTRRVLPYLKYFVL